MTSNLREYQKILAFNMAIWINKFLSNLNIHISPIPPPTTTAHYDFSHGDHPGMNIGSFLPVGDYISCSSDNAEEWCDDEFENFGEEYLGEMTENSANSQLPQRMNDTVNTGEPVPQ